MDLATFKNRARKKVTPGRRFLLTYQSKFTILVMLAAMKPNQQLRESSIMDDLLAQIKELIEQHYAAANSSLDDLETEINTLESNITDLRSAHDDLSSKIN
jgi:peptidoglycan hydrolase CwlO-like protein